jgi:hypothetical protein
MGEPTGADPAEWADTPALIEPPPRPNAASPSAGLSMAARTDAPPPSAGGTDAPPAPPGLLALETGAPRLRLAIPADLAATKAVPGLAADWQRRVRAGFRAAFAAGYVAVGFTRGAQPAYLLERRA